MKVIPVIEKVAKGLSNALMILASILAFLLMVIIVSDVLTRMISGHGLAGAVEYTEVLLVGIVFLAWAAAQRAGSHVTIDLLYERLKPVARHVMATFGFVLVIVCLVPLTVLSFESAIDAFTTGEFRIGVASTPVWPARAAVAVGLAAVILEILTQLLREIEAWVSGRTSSGVELDPELMV